MTPNITEIAADFRSGRSSPSDFLERCLARIDQWEDRVQAWVYIDRERVREDARSATAELHRGLDRGVLHGIPIGVKDLYDVFDMPTGGGSIRWAQSFARADCPVVARLRQAGALIVGKTVTTAYATFDPPKTRNPWNPDRTPGGSSSGSAAAVACGMIPAALGTQTGGSITRPASFCGTYGFKPTYGLVSLCGVLPLSTTLDHGGAIANNALDAAYVVQAMIGEAAGRPIWNARSAAECVRPKKLMILEGYFAERMDADMKPAFGALVDRLRTAGWDVVSRPLPVSWLEIPKNHRTIMGVEAAAYHGERIRRVPDDYPEKFTSLVEMGRTVDGAEYRRCRAHVDAVRAEVAEWIGTDDRLVLTPATLGAAPDPSTIGDSLFQAPWSYAGAPTISFPFAWTADGLPLCAQIGGRLGGEQDVIAVASAVIGDTRFPTRTPPWRP